MKATDIIPKKEKLGKAINHIVNQKPDNGKIVVTGTDLIKKFDYDFIDDGLIVTIDFNLKPLSGDFKVDEFWGNSIRIDIAGNREDGHINKKQMKDILYRAFDDYTDVINRKHQHYNQL